MSEDSIDIAQEITEEARKLEWLNLEAAVASGQRVLLFYGPSGCGKSFLACQWPNVAVLACDPGPLGGVPESALKFKPKVIKIATYDDLLNIFPKLKAEAGKTFDNIVVDSISFLQQKILLAVLQKVGREIPRFEEWNLTQARMRRVVSALAELPCGKIFTAVDGASKDEVSGKMQGFPDLSGKLAREVPQSCDAVVRLFVDTGYNKDMQTVVTYKFRTVPDETYYAKDRTGLLPAEGVLGTNPPSSSNPRPGFEVFKTLYKQVA